MAGRFACNKNSFLRCNLFKNAIHRSSKHVTTSAFLNSEKDTDNYKLPPVGRQLKSELASMGSKGFLRSVKEYNPPKDAREKVVGICSEFLNLKGKSKYSINSTPLTDRTLRFKIFTKCISQFDHDISSSQLYMINTIEDLIKYFNIPVNATTTMEDFKRADNLPPNLHIQQDYIRFHPDTDTKFGGVTAFPGSSTIVTGLTARKKYKGFKTESIPFNYGY